MGILGCASVCLGFLLLVIGVNGQGKQLTLTILHTNDVHSRFLETNKHSGGCTDEEKAKKECYGGFSRLHYKVSEIRKTHPNVVYLSGGDYFQGTIWYTLYKWEIIARFVNKFRHTAMALGNHEFDDGVAGLLPFLNNVTFPIIGANLDFSNEPRMVGKVRKSIVVDYEGRKVGIIGYTTRETKDISKPEQILFKDEVQSVADEAKRLHSQGVKILIAVGHAGYDVDMKVATAPYIDLVVGGHTNTFLYSGDKLPDIEPALGKYPTLVETNGRKVPVIQAYAYGKYLGYLNVTFNDAGEVVSWAGNPILLDGSVPQDSELEAEIMEAGKGVIEKSKKEVGKTRVFLDGSSQTCRLMECNLGNLIADAMVDINVEFADELHWSDVSLAMIHGGGIRSSIDEKAGKGSVSLEDILTVFPFENTIDLVEIKGKFIREAFEFSAAGYDPRGFHLAGKFLQVSGMRVVYDMRQPDGKRVKSLDVLCSKCRVPKFEPIQDNEVYKMALLTYTATGGDGFTMIQNNVINYHRSGILDSDMMLEYLRRRSPIIQGVEGRIKIINEGDESGDCSRAHLTSSSHIAGYFLLCLTLLFTRILH